MIGGGVGGEEEALEASYEYIDEAHDKTENHASNIQSMTDEEKLILMSFLFVSFAWGAPQMGIWYTFGVEEEGKSFHGGDFHR